MRNDIHGKVYYDVSTDVMKAVIDDQAITDNFLRDEHGEIMMLEGSPRSLRKNIKGFGKLFKRTDFRSRDKDIYG